MADDVRVWSDELARDPSSLVFLPLAETLRRQGQLDVARKVAIRGLERHPHNPDAHDQLARIQADRGDLQAAFDEWEMVLRLVPGHVGALKGMAFVRFQQGRLQEAEELLVQAQGVEEDGDVTAAIDTIRRSSGVRVSQVVLPPELPADPRALFADLLASDQSAMLVDNEGLVLAGAYYAADGRDVAQDVGASLSGVSDEALRATKHLSLGAWRSILFETEAAVVSLSPTPADGPATGGLMLVAAPPATPLGLLRRLLDRCLTRATLWLTKGGAGSGA
ncbi:MAG TPA: tetratricopeptide repeat protein [Gemmatimonadaceae bacterium]|nr:tetratricopeptide repeat protein [Gemmatimonadaceae bacterium]